MTLLKQKCSIQINFESSPRLPNTASICFNGVQSTLMLEKCKDQIEFSKSAACHSGIILVYRSPAHKKRNIRNEKWTSPKLCQM